MIVEKQAKRQMKVLSDGGGECTSNEFESFCTEMGIQHEVIEPYTPHGVADRRIKIIMDITRCMLREKKLLHSFWVKMSPNMLCAKQKPH